MRKHILFLLLASCAAVSAADNVPSDNSIRELLMVTDAKNLVDSMHQQMNLMMRNGIREGIKGQEISPAQQKIMDKSLADFEAIMSETLAWEKLEPLYIRVYQRSLTQEEVDGMIAFYKTPIGQTMIHKMPAIIQNTMAEMQNMMAPIVQRMEQSQQRLIADLQADQKEKAAK